MRGNFIISLDFELHWGGAEKWDVKQKREYFQNTRDSIHLVLELFKKYNISVTWATVGFLFNESKEEFIDNMPLKIPSYTNNILNYYRLKDSIGANEKEDVLHYAKSLIDLVISYPKQELASHTYCHYYALEEGQTAEQFDADLIAAQNISLLKYNKKLKSLVFPRNQFNDAYIKVAKKNDFTVVRSNPNVWFWKRKEGKITSLFRAMDTLFPISTTLCFEDRDVIREQGVVCLPASRFFRSYKDGEKIIQRPKMWRIKREMSYAAKNNLNYHLWWHPHNFADNIEKNLCQLEEILMHYSFLNSTYGFNSLSMGDYNNI